MPIEIDDWVVPVAGDDGVERQVIDIAGAVPGQRWLYFHTRTVGTEPSYRLSQSPPSAAAAAAALLANDKGNT